MTDVQRGQAGRATACMKSTLKRYKSIKNAKKYNFRIIAKNLVTGMVLPMPIETKIIHLHGLRTARALRAMADRAESGDVHGVVLAARTTSGELDLRLAGVYERSPALAYRDSARVLDALLYREDDEG